MQPLVYYKAGRRIICALVLTAGVNLSVGFAQGNGMPPLERSVTLNVKNAETRDVLNKISQQIDATFSYSSDAFTPASNIDMAVQDKPVRLVLNTMFRGAVNYKVKGRYIILTPNRDFGVAASSVGAKRTIEGYITEPISGKKLSGVTIYDRNSMASATTNEYGYFKLTLPESETTPEVKVSKTGYLDRTLSQTKDAFSFIVVNLSLDSLKQSFGLRDTATLNDTASWIPKWLIPRKLMANTENLTDTLFRKVQFSVLPYVGSNQLLTGNVENNFSFNLVAGYVQGIRYAEVGGVLNVVRDSVRYLQVAGVGNIVGKGMRGVQMAGVFNKTMRMDGVQLSGGINFVQEDSRYLQMSGTANITMGYHSGIQYAGMFNMAKQFKGIQVAALFNIAKTAQGAQVSWGYNRAKRIRGIQATTFLNDADTVSGVQISVGLNKTKFLKGFQLGLVNISDSCDGLPLGLFSYVRKGYHNLEFSSDDIFYANVAYRSGVNALHSIMFAGIHPKSKEDALWSLGLGLGSTIRVKGKLFMDVDITAQQMLKGDVYLKNSALYKAYLGLEHKLSRTTSLAAGATINFMVFDLSNQNSVDNLSTLVPHTLINENNGNGYIHQTWLGWKVALRFY